MVMLELIKVIIYGIVEGITEWLPISSTGHLILLNKFMPLQVSAEFFEMFKVIIQLGAILAVIVLYFNKLNPFSPTKTHLQRKETLSIWYKVAIATIPAVLVYKLDDWIEANFMNAFTVALMLILYGVGFIFIEKHYKHVEKMKTLESLTYQTALFIGMAQVLALIPGTSRSGATILAAILLGTSRYVATEFSFFLGIPAMFGLSTLKLIRFGFHYSLEEVLILIVGVLVSFLVSMIVIQKLLSYIKKHDFTVFGKYRIVLGIIVLIAGFL
ncbi:MULTISPECIES: undecaprenyl-diphosphate phosphatase [unclassified Granulicatella]|uniref:undecaprenyl-diphosphate phosphatase n=1 Tax=unclassified Granulicatella TaxID=2630493 RepID=UPI00107461EC|nr:MULTISPECIES: undecaprenyl-diphosphate phosphatase [unclassified Granulicatella]MBF0779965.1 undecaprenyl-diphosphate phosphatase [Granulicatella sp. 19428wC4_WM01]TFU95981.1 undecaprenyl-diphosphate phosphatase [Granulicatella sp. WM01]